jgi:DNA-binding response OmpR family regulator
MECLKEIEDEGYLPVLVITAQPEHKLRALKAGAKDFVSKPFDMAELRARVHNILEVRLQHLELKNYSKVLEETVRELEATRELLSP